jgi:hypothetical protein
MAHAGKEVRAKPVVDLLNDRDAEADIQARPDTPARNGAAKARLPRCRGLAEHPSLAACAADKRRAGTLKIVA